MPGKDNKDNIPGALVIEGHVQGLAITRSLGEKGIPVIIVDTGNCIARYSRYCKGFYKCPDYKSEAFIIFLLKLAEERNLQGWVIYPSNDFAVVNLSMNRDKLSRCCRIITPGYDVIEKIYNKGQLLRLAASIGVDIPKTYFPRDLTLNGFDQGYPVIIKGKEGLHFYKTMRTKAFLAKNGDELANHLKYIIEKIAVEDIMIQELIPYRKNVGVISFTAFCIDGEINAYWVGEKLREHPLRFGTATFCRSIPGREVVDSSAALLKKLSYTGVCEIEYLKDPTDDKYKLIEMNARTWLWVSLAGRCGIDYPLMIYNYLHGIEQKYPANYEVGVKWIHFWTDLFFIIKGTFKGQYRLRDIIRSYKGKKEWAVFSLKDLKPAIMEFILLLYLIRRRR